MAANLPAPLHGKTLHLDQIELTDTALAVLKAIASNQRWRILQCLSGGTQSVVAVAEALRMPLSTATAHIRILEDAGLIVTELRPAAHGLQKMCARTYDNVLIDLPRIAPEPYGVVEVSMPIGAYNHAEVMPTCGLATTTGLIGFLDDPVSFFEPNRVNAGLIWFRHGFLEWTFPNRLPPGARLESVQVSMEICSEAPLHNNNWPSDITLLINGVEIGTWTSPGDFGGERGALTPAWWDDKDSQYGLLKRWTVGSRGSFIDGLPLSPVASDALNIPGRPLITLRLGVPRDASHVGGINLFGRTFGNYPQDLVLRLTYRPHTGSGTDELRGRQK